MDTKITVDKKKFEEQGYLVIKNVFSPEEIEAFRTDCYKQFELDSKKGLNYNIQKTRARSLRGDLVSKALIRKIILDDRIIYILKELLGPDLVYFGDSTLQFGVGFRGFHRDNVDRQFNEGPDWESDYPIFRFGLYLQDHRNFSGGLKVKAGSHKNKSGKSIILDNEAGDFAIWNMRTLHSGNAVRLKLFPKLPIDYFERFVPAFLKVDESKERILVACAFAQEGKALDRYISMYMQKAAPILANMKNSPLDEVALNELKSKGIKLVKPSSDYGK
jgi:hypothetical protein